MVMSVVALKPMARAATKDVNLYVHPTWYLLVIEHNYGKWLFIDDLPIEKGDFPKLCKRLSEGKWAITKNHILDGCLQTGMHP